MASSGLVTQHSLPVRSQIPGCEAVGRGNTESKTHSGLMADVAVPVSLLLFLCLTFSQALGKIYKNEGKYLRLHFLLFFLLMPGGYVFT